MIKLFAPVCLVLATNALFAQAKSATVCGEDMKLYTCNDGYIYSRPTCTQAVSEYLGYKHFYQRCDCVAPKLYDESSGECVYPKDCPKPTVEEGCPGYQPKCKSDCEDCTSEDDDDSQS